MRELSFDLCNGFLLWLEHQCEGNTNHNGKGGEDKPTRLPVTNKKTLLLTINDKILPRAETVDDITSRQCSDGCAKAVSHHHKQSLSRCLNLRIAFLVDKDTARDIEEVEGDTIDDTLQDEENGSRHGGISNAKQTKAEYPCEERHQHHNLNAETLQEERNQQNTASLADLGNRGKQCGIVGSKRVGILRNSLETRQEGTCEAIGHLQTHAEQC